METTFRFRPIGFNWVAIHPAPKGVISFIGGAGFGTFPMIFYRYFLKGLYDAGYTIIALPYRFTFRHWSVALGLTKDQRGLRSLIFQEAKRLGYETDIYQEDPTSKNPNYFWIGHSLGCKYIALLELITDLELTLIEGEGQDKKNIYLTEENIEKIPVFKECSIGKEQKLELARTLRDIPLDEVSLLNQPSVLMAPLITGLRGAVPITALANFLEKTFPFLRVIPDVKQTLCLIKNSDLFNLTALIAFLSDNIMKEAKTVQWLKENIPDRLVDSADLAGGHLVPLGWRDGDEQIVDKALVFLDEASQKLAQISRSTVTLA